MRHTLTILSLCAALSAAEKQEINAMIDDIVNASPQSRYEKMNAFKQKMREMNRQQRSEALDALREKAYPDLEPQRLSQPQNALPSGNAKIGNTGQQQLQLQQQQMRQQQQQEQTRQHSKAQ